MSWLMMKVRSPVESSGTRTAGRREAKRQETSRPLEGGGCKDNGAGRMPVAQEHSKGAGRLPAAQEPKTSARCRLGPVGQNQLAAVWLTCAGRPN